MPTGSSRSSSTANASIEIVPTTRRALAADEHLGAGQVAAEAVRVADRDDADPRRPLGDEAPAVARRSPGASRFTCASSARQRERRLEPVLGRVGAERRDAVERDAAAGGVEARRGEAQRAALFARCRVQARDTAPSPRGSARAAARAKAGSESAVARWLISPTTSRGSAGSSESPQRPMPVSSFRCTGTPSGTAPLGDRELEPGLARRAPISSAVGGPMTRMRAGPERSPQRERLRRRSRRRARVAPASSAARRDVARAVPVAVRLDDRPELGAAERVAGAPRVAPHRAEVDRDLGAVHARYPASDRRQRASRSLATRPARGTSAAAAASAVRGRARPRPRAAAPAPSRGTPRRFRSARPRAGGRERRVPETQTSDALARRRDERVGALEQARRSRSARRSAATASSGARRPTSTPRRAAAPSSPACGVSTRRRARQLDRLELPQRVGVDDDRQLELARAAAARAPCRRCGRARAERAGPIASATRLGAQPRAVPPRPRQRPLHRLEQPRLDDRQRRLGDGDGDVARVRAEAAAAREHGSAGQPGRAADDEHAPGACTCCPRAACAARARGSRASRGACAVCARLEPDVRDHDLARVEAARARPRGRPSRPWNVTVSVGATAAPGDLAVDASTPGGDVDRDDRRAARVDLLDRRAAASRGGSPWKPVPKSASHDHDPASLDRRLASTASSRPASRSTARATRPSPPFAPPPQTTATARVREALERLLGDGAARRAPSAPRRPVRTRSSAARISAAV